MYINLLENKKSLTMILLFFLIIVIFSLVIMVGLILLTNSLNGGDDMFIKINEAIERRLSIDYPDFEYRALMEKRNFSITSYSSEQLIEEELLKEEDMKLNFFIKCESEIEVYKNIYYYEEDVIYYYINLTCNGVDFYYEGFNS